MKDTYVYRIGDNLYVNLTSRCTNRCRFCVREGKTEYEGHALWLTGHEPTAEEVISLIGDPTRYHEIVFCGFGEPTHRLSEMLKICDAVHAGGGKTRLNTNGHGNVINQENIAPLLVGRLDGVNISLNAPTKEEYDEVCRPQIDGAFSAVLDFAKCLHAAGVNCWFSVVDCIGKEKVAACLEIANEYKIPLRVREMIE